MFLCFRGFGRFRRSCLSKPLIEGQRSPPAVDGARRLMVEHAERARAELAALTPSASADVLTGIAAWMTSEMA